MNMMVVFKRLKAPVLTHDIKDRDATRVAMMP